MSHLILHYTNIQIIYPISKNNVTSKKYTSMWRSTIYFYFPSVLMKHCSLICYAKAEEKKTFDFFSTTMYFVSIKQHKKIYIFYYKI